jgi:hypothetical protein
MKDIMDIIKNIKECYERNWSGFSEYKVKNGPFDKLPQEFSVLKFEPNKSRISGHTPLAECRRGLKMIYMELHIFSEEESDFLIVMYKFFL